MALAMAGGGGGACSQDMFGYSNEHKSFFVDLHFDGQASSIVMVKPRSVI